MDALSLLRDVLLLVLAVYATVCTKYIIRAQAIIRLAQHHKDLAEHRQRVIDWCDEREVFLRPVVMAAKASTTGARAHTDREWGYSMGMPSKTSLDMVYLAREIEQERDKAAKTMREYFAGLELWEANHPVPEFGKETVVIQTVATERSKTVESSILGQLPPPIDPSRLGQ